MTEKMTQKQKAFVRYYLECNNATQAAIEAGYSPKTARQAGQRLLTFVDIRQAIDAFNEKADSLAEMTLAQRKAFLAKVIAETDIERVSLGDALKAVDLLNKLDGAYSGRECDSVTVSLQVFLPDGRPFNMADRGRTYDPIESSSTVSPPNCSS